jgi:hypothetical protein
MPHVSSFALNIRLSRHSDKLTKLAAKAARLSGILLHFFLKKINISSSRAALAASFVSLSECRDRRVLRAKLET